MNKNFLIKKQFNEEGYGVITNYLPEDTVKKINQELDEIFYQILFNGFNKGSITLDQTYSREAITTPCINIKSINLMELIIDVFNLVVDDDKKKNYIVSSIMIFTEKKNSSPLKFHTDLRKGMYRAQIYLKGGDKNSGGFRYIKKSHNFNHGVSHELSDTELEKYRKDIIDLTGTEGDLIIFDSFGFHGKYPCLNERRNILFEFQPIDSDYPKTQIDFNGSLISNKVLSNLNIFMHNDTKNHHYLDKYKNNYLINFKIWFGLITKVTRIAFNEGLKKITTKIKRKLLKIL